MIFIMENYFRFLGGKVDFLNKIINFERNI